MKLMTLLKWLRAHHVHLSTDGRRLHITGPKGAVTEPMRQALAAHKTRLIKLLPATAGRGRAADKIEVPGTEGYHAYWLLHHLYPDSGICRHGLHLALKGRFSEAAWEQALNHVCTRVDPLRFYMEVQRGIPRIVCRGRVALVLDVVDLSGLPRPLAHHAARRFRRPSETTIDPREPPLIRARVLRLRPDRHLLTCHLHGMITDQIGLCRFARVVGEAYAALLAAAAPPPLPANALPTTFFSRRPAAVARLAKNGRLRARRKQLEPFAQDWVPFTEREPGLSGSFQTRNHLLHLPHTLYTRLAASAFPPRLAGLTAFAFCLAELSGRPRFLLAVPHDRRTDLQAPHLLGNLTELLVLTVDAVPRKRAGTDTLQLFARRMAAAEEAAFRYRDIPFHILVEQLTDHRFTGRHPLTQVAFSPEPRTHLCWRPPGARARRFGRFNRLSPFDLTLIWHEDQDSLSARIEYCEALFHPDTISRFADYLVHTLNLLADAPHTPTRYVLPVPPPLPAAPRPPVTEPLHVPIQRHVRQGPFRIACSFGDTQLTYDQLNREANRLAHYLYDRGVRPGDVVGLFLDRSQEILTSVLAVLKAGACFLPLDPTFPKSRRRLVLADAAPRMILTNNHLLPDLGPTRTWPLCLRARATEIAEHPGVNPPVRVPPEADAMLVFTSGPSDRPHGVRVTHAALAAYFRELAETSGLNGETVWAATTSLSFGMSVTELLLPLSLGGRVVLVPRPTVMDGAALARLLTLERVTAMQATPFIWRRLIAAGGTPPRTVFCHGEMLEPTLAQRLSAGADCCIRLGDCLETAGAAFAANIWRGNSDQLLGRPLGHLSAILLDDHLNPVPPGKPGTLYLGGPYLSPGYRGRPALTAARFLPDPRGCGARMMLSDLWVREIHDGRLQRLGKLSKTEMLHGHLVDLAEIEAVLAGHPSLSHALALLHTCDLAPPRLVAYVVSASERPPDLPALAALLEEALPKYMVPTDLIPLATLPLNEDGSLDPTLLPAPTQPLSRARDSVPPRTTAESLLLRAWKRLLGLTDLGVHDHFFDMGGDSLLLLRAYKELPTIIKNRVALTDLFAHPTIARICERLGEEEDHRRVPLAWGSKYKADAAQAMGRARPERSHHIAVIGMACRFPKADTPEAFWRMLIQGKHALEQVPFGHPPPDMEADLRHGTYVPVRALLEGIALFDAAFFGFTPLEAQITDPQQRLFLVCAWEALESAGYAPGLCREPIGIYGGVGHNHYLARHLLPNPVVVRNVGHLPLMIGNAVDNLCTRVSFKLGLTGPGVVVQTNCSTALVAVHTACQALRNKECNMALAGGVELGDPRPVGYIYEEGMSLSPDGVIRPFDARAAGTVPGQGAGMVLLKPLLEAVRDGDHVHAVIIGSAVNNDGAHKTSYTGYAVAGQTAVLREAHQQAGTVPARIGLVETSSTASLLGDPIEVAGLREAFGSLPEGTCALGCVKPNVGNLGAASGVCALIKVVLAVGRGFLPPTLNVTRPNPDLLLEGSPFYINDRLQPWPGPRIGGVSSFGLGGTNAHVLVGQAPPTTLSRLTRPAELLVLSARSQEALEALTDKLVRELTRRPYLNFGDLAYTLGTRCIDGPARRMLVCGNLPEAVLHLQQRDPKYVFTRMTTHKNPSLAFLFPGNGVQYQGMEDGLLATEPFFADRVKTCRDLVAGPYPWLERAMVKAASGVRLPGNKELIVRHLSLFIYQYALAELLLHWGLRPSAVVGDRMGAFICAVVAGVFRLEDALELVILRARLARRTHHHHLTLHMPRSAVVDVLPEGVRLNMSITPNECLVSGDKQGIDALQADLKKHDIPCEPPSQGTHLPHLLLSEEDAAELYPRLHQMQLSPPQIPIISPLTGTYLRDADACDPGFWSRLTAAPDAFDQGIGTLLEDPERILLEVAPDRLTAPLVNRHGTISASHTVLTLARPPAAPEDVPADVMTTLGRLWLAGIRPDWEALHADRPRYRLPLPTYPFEQRAFWIDCAEPANPDPALESDEPLHLPIPVSGEPYRPNVSVAYVAPRDTVEERLAALWRRHLGLEKIGVHDDFFELGGCSLAAVRLTRTLSETFGVPASTHVLLKRSTIASLGHYLKNHGMAPTTETQTPLVELQAGKPGRTPIFLVHPVGGEVYIYRDLARHLGPEWPIYGFQAQSLLGDQPPFNNLEEQAAAYVEVLTTHHPRTPYLLGGASYGGLVAYEMARILKARSRQVPFLIMIDTPGPGKMPKTLSSTAHVLHYMLGEKHGLSLNKLMALGDTEAQLAYVMEEARAGNQIGALPPHLGKPMLDTWMAHQEAMVGYHPGPYQGHVVYFSATEHLPPNPVNMHGSWIDLVAGGIEIYRVPGNHLTMNHGGNAKVTARHLKQVLETRLPPTDLPN